MTTLFVIGLLLIGLFGYLCGAYLAFYKFALQSGIAKGLAFLALGTVISFVTFFISLAIIWPGVM